MKVQIIKDSNNKNIGWSIEGETEEEKLILNTIRNMQFFGFGDESIEYAGRTNSKGIDDVGTLSWKQRKHIKH